MDALSRVPASDESQRLAGEARACQRVVHSWRHAAPSAEEREALMKRVLNLHIATAQLRRDSEPPSGTRRSRGDPPPAR
mgnify:CR=1 FL=1